MTTQPTFPDTPEFTGFNTPVRIEWSQDALVVEGEIPAEIDGAFYRAVPDRAVPPLYENDTFISGDGMISRFRIRGNQVDFAIRYVQTERYLAERKARRALFGAYRNPFTDDPSVNGLDRGVVNTTPIWHAGRLFMTKEDSRAVEIHPERLETLGSWDYHGALKSETMTAHARIDRDTGEMFFFGYEAAGLATRDVAYCIADKAGNLVSEQWFQAPYCAMLHDFAITENYVLFPVMPTIADYDRIKAGGAHWVHESDRESWIGIMPRYGNVAEMRWFKGPVGISVFHIMNAFEKDGKIHIDLHVTSTNAFPFIRAASGIEIHPSQIEGALQRWSFDFGAETDSFEVQDIGPPGEMPRIADKDQGRPYRIAYYNSYNPQFGPPNIHGPVCTGFNSLLRIELGNGKVDMLPMAQDVSISEIIHIESKQPAHEGWLAAVVDNHTDMRSELWFFDAGFVEQGPIAKVKVPIRLFPQIHGTWVSAAKLARAVHT